MVGPNPSLMTLQLHLFCWHPRSSRAGRVIHFIAGGAAFPDPL